MKKVFLAYLLLMAFVSQAKDKPVWSYSVKINGIRDTVCYWGYHFGEKQYVSDTVRVDSKGNMVFEGSKPLEGGIYLIIMPNKKYIEVIIAGENAFSIETDTADVVRSMKVKGSKENDLFYKYLVFINDRQKESEPYRRRLDKVKDNKDSTAYYRSKLDEVDKRVAAYKKKFMEDHADAFVAKIFRTTQEPEVPEVPLLPNGRKDSTFTYRYYKQHFFDQVDFSDVRLLRTPILQSKINFYMDKLTYQIPDSLLASARVVIERSKANRDVFKFALITLTSQFETSKMMGMDAVFVGLVEDYYKTGQAYWADSTTLFKITDRARVLKPLLIGKKTPALTLKDTSGFYHSLYDLPAKYTVLLFWDPDCSHCKKTVPKVREWYTANKDRGLEVYAVCTETEKDKWKKFIREHNLNWINVADIELQNRFRSIYDISSTPVIYLLNKDKEIFAKKIGVEQLSEIIDGYERMKRSK